MMRPRIGLIPGTKAGDPGRPNPSKGCIAALSRAGCELVVIDYRSAVRDQNALLLRLDALLLQGGGDAHPSRFGEPIHPHCGAIDLLRDELEFRALELLIPHGVPMLGICRGAQMLNVALGGTLYQDLPSQLGLEHQLGESPHPAHELIIEPGTRLMDIVRAPRLRTNSLHHQSIKALGRGLVASARTPDGIVEAIELPGERFLMGLQWHPEITIDQDGASIRIFQAFIDSI